MGSGWRRGRTAAALSAGLLSVAVAAASCAAPQFTYVADSPAKAYFKVPYSWHKVDDIQLKVVLDSLTSTFGGNANPWTAGYAPDTSLSAADFYSFRIDKPLVVAIVVNLNSAASNAMSYNLLKNFVLPVTASARQFAASNGTPLSNFQLIAEHTLTPGQGVHGVRDVFAYTIAGTTTDIFDEVGFTNANSTMAYILIVHCTAACYQSNFTVINMVMTSFTVRSQ